MRRSLLAIILTALTLTLSIASSRATPWPFPAAVILARWKAEYAQNSYEVQEWFRRQQTTPEFRERVQKDWYLYCCDHSDVVEAEFSKDGTGWKYRLPGTTEWILLPPDVVQEDIPTPSSRPVLFINMTPFLPHGQPTCFFPGAAGT